MDLDYETVDLDALRTEVETALATPPGLHAVDVEGCTLAPGCITATCRMRTTHAAASVVLAVELGDLSIGNATALPSKRTDSSSSSSTVSTGTIAGIVCAGLLVVLLLVLLGGRHRRKQRKIALAAPLSTDAAFNIDNPLYTGASPPAVQGASRGAQQAWCMTQNPAYASGDVMEGVYGTVEENDRARTGTAAVTTDSVLYDTASPSSDAKEDTARLQALQLYDMATGPLETDTDMSADAVKTISGQLVLYDTASSETGAIGGQMVLYDTASSETGAQMYATPLDLQAMQVYDVANGTSGTEPDTVTSTACDDMPTYDIAGASAGAEAMSNQPLYDVA